MRSFRIIKSEIIGYSMKMISFFIILIAVMIGVGLYMKSLPLLKTESFFQLLSSEQWKPFQGQFGFLPYLMGTLWVTGIAIVISLPLCLLTAIYLSEYASPKMKSLVNPMIDLLSGIPSVVYGVWGVLVIVPFIGNKVAPHVAEFSSGYTLL